MSKSHTSRLCTFLGALCIIGAIAPPLFAQNIQIAILRGDYELVKGFLDDGVSPDSYNSSGFAPIHSAVRAGRIDLARLILDYGGDINIQSLSNIDGGQAALHIAARNGYFDLLRLLLERNADPNIQDDVGNTPLHDAAISGDRTIARALVLAGADVNALNNDGRSVLQVADAALRSFDLSGIVFRVPITVSSQIDIDDLLDPASNIGTNALLRGDIEVGFSVLFPLGDSTVSMGPEMGVSIPIASLVAGGLILHVPIRAVVIFAPTRNINIDVLAGIELNIWNEERIKFTDLTFEIGARLDARGFLVGLQYTLPFAIPFGDPQVAYSSLNSYVANYWQNALTLSVGYRIEI